MAAIAEALQGETMTPKQQAICDKYRAKDKDGYVHCHECPLQIRPYELMCMANAHYDRRRKEWVFDTEA